MKILELIVSMLNIGITLLLALILSFGIITLAYSQPLPPIIADPNMDIVKISKKNIPLVFYWGYDRPAPEDLFGFELLISTSQGIYDPNDIYAIIQDPNALKYTATPLTKEGLYYFMIQAIDDSDNKSGPSNEVAVDIDWAPPKARGFGCLPGI